MNVQIKQLYSLLDKEFNIYQTRLIDRVSGNWDAEWFLKDNQSHFMPDYLTLGQFGRKKTHLFFNTFITKLSWKYWHKWIQPALLGEISTQVQTRFIPKNLLGEYHQTIIHHFNLHLNTLLMSPSEHLKDSTFIELFQFIFNSFSILKEVMGLPNDTYEPQKKSHTHFCLTAVNEIHNELKDHPQNLKILSYLAVRSNWIDVVEHNLPSFLRGFMEEINEIMEDPTYIKEILTNTPNYHAEAF